MTATMENGRMDTNLIYFVFQKFFIWEKNCIVPSMRDARSKSLIESPEFSHKRMEKIDRRYILS